MTAIARLDFRYQELPGNLNALMNNTQLAIHFFLQLAVILLFCRIVGAIAVRFGQPQVVAEMIAGVLLGPSLFGLARAGVAGVAFPVGQDADDARHAELPFSRVAARSRALHVHRRDGISHGHHPHAAEELHRGFGRRHGRAVRPRRRARRGCFSITPSFSRSGRR